MADENKIKALGPVNLNSIEEYREVSEKYEFITGQRNDIYKAKTDLEKVIADLVSEMKEQFLKCSVFVCPSVIENSPNSLGEAMLLGVPVAASRIGGIPDMVSENKDGVLFEKGNVDDIVKAILQIWDEPVIAAVYGDNAAAHARLTHNADATHDLL